MKQVIGGLVKNDGTIRYNKCVSKEDKKQYTKNSVIIEYENKLRDFCLNCKRKKCGGICTDYSDFQHNLIEEYRGNEGFNI